MIEMPNDSNFWLGVVEDRIDPNFIGRVRVRIVGKHNLSLSDIPTEDLPWAHVIHPTTSGTISGVGVSPTGIPEGTWVIGTTMGGYLFIKGILPGYISEEMKKNFRSDLNFDNDQSETGARDTRSEEDLEEAPRAGFFAMEVREGEGDEAGVIAEDNPPQRYPLELNGEVRQTKEIATDANPIATNDKKTIDRTLVGWKSRTREDGGIRDEVTLIAIFPKEKFKTGIRNNFGTSKANCRYNENLILKSTNFPSVFSNYAAVKEDPTNSNGEPVYQERE